MLIFSLSAIEKLTLKAELLLLVHSCLQKDEKPNIPIEN